MNRTSTMNSTRNSFAVAIVILLLGGGISSVLVFHHFHLLHESGLLSQMCSAASSGGCDAVNRSDYSSVLGIPLASIGAWYYLTLAGLLLLAGAVSQGLRSTVARFCFFALCAGCAIDLALLAIQLFIVKAFCVLCVSTYATTFAAAFTLRASRTPGKAEPEAAASGEKKILLTAGFAGSVLLFLCIIAATMLMRYGDPGYLEEKYAASAIEEFSRGAVIPFDLQGTPMQGAPDAKLKIVIFSDFLCPWCKQVAQSFQQFMPKWKDRVAVYYKSYPLDALCNPYDRGSTHPGACWPALGALCATEQGKFWEFHDRIFDRPPKNPGHADVMRIAGEAGIDTIALSACMRMGSMQKMVKDQIITAHGLGIDGTPRIYINGRKLPKLSYLYAVLGFEAKRLGIRPLEGLKE